MLGKMANHLASLDVSILDDLNTVAYQNNIGELSWVLDNQFLAIPDSMTITSPMMDQVRNQLFLRQETNSWSPVH